MKTPTEQTVRVSRATFLGEPGGPTMWVYRPGEHVTILGVTGSGKTELIYDLLDRARLPRVTPIIIVPQPRDPVATRQGKRLGLKTVRSWPPASNLNPFSRPWGYNLWPTHTFDEDQDEPRHAAIYRSAMRDSLERGNRILVADEVVTLAVDLRLKRTLSSVWRAGRKMGCGIWAASQRPADVPVEAYGQCQHLFIAHDPDQRSRERYREIGGIDPAIVFRDVSALKRFEWLYIRREDQRRCIIEAS